MTKSGPSTRGIRHRGLGSSTPITDAGRMAARLPAVSFGASKRPLVCTCAFAFGAYAPGKKFFRVGVGIVVGDGARGHVAASVARRGAWQYRQV